MAIAIAGAGAWFVLRPADGPRGPEAMLDLLPSDTTAAFVIPDAASALADLKALKDRFSGRLAAIEPLIGEASRIAGFDLNDPRSMTGLGLRPGGGFATAIGPEWAVVVFAVEDRSQFEGFVKARFEEELGGTLTWTSMDKEGFKVRMARTGADASSDVFGLLYVGGHAVVAPTTNWKGERVDPAASLLKVARTTPDQAMSSKADLMGPLRQVGLDRTAVLVMDVARSARWGAKAADDGGRSRDAEALRRASKQVTGLAVGLGVGGDGLRLPFALGGPPEAVQAMRAAFTPVGAGPNYAKVAPPDGMLHLSLAFNPTGLMPWLRQQLMDYERKVVDQTLQASKEASGTDFEKDVLPLLSGHVGFVFSTLDMATIGQRLLNNLGATSTVALEKPGAVTTTTFLGLKDGAAMTRIVEEAIAAAEAKLGGTIPTLVRVEGKSAWRVREEGAEVLGFAVEGDTLVMTTGRDRLEGALARIKGEDKGAKSLGDRIVVPAAKVALDPSNNLSLLVSAPVLFGNFPLLNLWKPAAPAKLLAEAVWVTKVTATGVGGELMLTLPPPPKQGSAP